jgi:hypothetical protein
MELQVAGTRKQEVSMTRMSRLTRLALRYLPLLVVSLELIKVVVELVSKVVNYDRPVRKFRLLVRA